MAAVSKKEPNQPRKRAPARTPEARENQMISLAIDLAEEQLSAGTASSQVITHFLKLGSTRERLEKEKLIEENALLKAKTDALKSQDRSDALYAEALAAFSRYNGRPDGGNTDEEFEE